MVGRAGDARPGAASGYRLLIGSAVLCRIGPGRRLSTIVPQPVFGFFCRKDQFAKFTALNPVGRKATPDYDVPRSAPVTHEFALPHQTQLGASHRRRQGWAAQL